MLLHRLRKEFNHRYDYGIAELAVSLSVRNWYFPAPIASIEAHQTGAFERRQPPWPFAGLGNQDF